MTRTRAAKAAYALLRRSEVSPGFDVFTKQPATGIPQDVD